jgi:hypothetical protein
MRMGTNTSQWDSRDIEALFRAAAAGLGMEFKALVQAKTYRAKRKGNVSMASAATDRKRVTLKLAVPGRFTVDPVSALAHADKHPLGTLTGKSLLKVLGTVVWGVRYVNGFRDRFSHDFGGVAPPWAAGLILRPKAKAKGKGRTVGVELQETRLAEAEAKLAVWTTKLKRAQTMTKKYACEVRKRKRKIAKLHPLSAFPGSGSA